jgi:putative hydroxymethylpyrimidine transport system permease protein
MSRLSLSKSIILPVESRAVPRGHWPVWPSAVPWSALLTGCGLLLAWELAVRLFAVPAFLLPAPSRIVATLAQRWPVILPEALVTFGEMLGGLLIGSVFGIASALLMASSQRLERAVGPLLVVSQALPVFAIAPLLVVWLGFGLASKLAMAALVIFFPVTTTFFEGLRRTDAGLIELGQLNRASRSQTLLLIRVPAALPALGAGLRVAAASAPIGAIIGEWVGSSSGLGLLMLHANARMQTDMVFAGLTVLVVFSMALWGAVGALTRRLVFWAPDTLAPFASQGD